MSFPLDYVFVIIEGILFLDKKKLKISFKKGKSH